MGIIETVKKGFGVATKSLGLVLALFVFNLIWNLASIPLAVAPGAAVTPQQSVTALMFSILFILASIFIQGSSLGLVRDYVKEGRMKLANFFGYGLKYYLRLFLLGLIIILIIAIVALVASLIVIATTPLNNTALTIVATIVAIIIGAIGLYYVLLLIMSPYSIVCDEAGVIESMKKSVAVVRKAIGKILLLLVVLILIALGIGFVIGFLAGLITVAMPALAGQIVMGVITSLLNGYLGVVMTASFLGYYLVISGKGSPAGEKVF